MSTFSTSSRYGSHRSNRDRKSSNSIAKSCYLCKKPHDLDTCSEFSRKIVHERKEFARSKGLCFGCLIQGHKSKECNQRITCRTCARPPTSLHGDSRKCDRNAKVDTDSGDQIAKSATLPTKTCFKGDHSKSQSNSVIVPVWLHHFDDPQNERLVYAILDHQSDTTFVREKTIHQLGVTGPETQLLLSTMHAENRPIVSQRIGGLVVRNFNREVIIQLPRSFSSEKIPARRDQIPRPEAARQWPHMERIADRLMPYQDDMEIGLLIGSDCPRAIIPCEVIPGNDDNPYAQRTDLGWGIIGRVGQTHADEVKEEGRVGVTHRIISREVWDPADCSKKICHFSVNTQVKEMINPFLIKQMLELDFSERKTEERMLSQDDRKFLKKMEESIHQEHDGHYQMPLPFR